MRLKRIKVKNFKSFINEEFTFNTNTNANYIYGANGIGKSTFIDIIRALGEFICKERNISSSKQLPTQVREIFKNLNNNEIYKKYITLGSNDSILIEIEILDNINNMTYLYSLEFIDGDVVVRETFVELNSKGKITNVYIEKKLNEKFSINEHIVSLFDLERYNLNKNITSSILSILFDLGNTKNINENILNHPIWRFILVFILKNDVIPLYINDLSLHHNTVISKDINGRPTGAQSENDIYQNIVNYLKSFEVFAMSIDKSIRAVKPFIVKEDNLTKIVSYYFEKKLANGEIVNVPVIRESSGTKRYLHLYSIIHRLQSESLDIIFIDEIERGLHEELLISFVNYLNKTAIDNDKNVFITTHSAILLNDRFINKYNKNINKERHFMNKDINGKIIISDLSSENVRNNNHLKFLLGNYGANPNITGVYTENDE